MKQATPAELVHDLVSAWNAGDSKAFASLFTEDAQYVTGDGAWLDGREAIEGFVAGAERRDTALVTVQELTIRVYDRVATAVFRWRGSGDVPVGGVVTCVLLDQLGRWKVVHLQNTDASIAGSDHERSPGS